MPDRCSLEQRVALDQLGKWIGRMLVAVARQRNERLEIANRLQPDAHCVPVMATPALRSQSSVHAVEQRKIQQSDDEVAPRLDELHDCAESRNCLRRTDALRRQLTEQPLQQGACSRLAFES